MSGLLSEQQDQAHGEKGPLGLDSFRLGRGELLGPKGCAMGPCLVPEIILPSEINHNRSKPTLNLVNTLMRWSNAADQGWSSVASGTSKARMREVAE